MNGRSSSKLYLDNQHIPSDDRICKRAGKKKENGLLFDNMKLGQHLIGPLIQTLQLWQDTVTFQIVG